jgi:hypothetical protein
MNHRVIQGTFDCFHYIADIAHGEEGDSSLESGTRTLYDVLELQIYIYGSEVELSEYLDQHYIDMITDQAIDEYAKGL